MRVFIQSNDYACWNIIENVPIIPTKTTKRGVVVKTQDKWTPVDTKDI